MDWKSIQFDWNRAKAFLVTAEEGSLSAAARALGTTQPTLGRQVAALEEELDVILFDRVGKQLVLTPSGLELVDHVRQMSEAAIRISLIARGQSQQLDGEVCITATEGASVFFLPPILKKIHDDYPGISVELIASDKVSDLNRREADIAIRHVRPTQPELIAKKVCSLNARLYGTPEYIDQLGRPVTIECLNKANYIHFNRRDEAIESLKRIGLTLSANNFRTTTESSLVQWELTKLGVGLGMMIENYGDAEPLVERVQPDSHVISFPIWLVAHHQLKSSKRVRAVFDLLSDSIAKLKD